ncbi:unnamed protein product [Didymodactylos carnosus]|uniref:Uncharacterized protein n=1 Tax=Didymodactylos carnosus TaxID=1234261 RepID=A0A813VM66_9BILA|nr:unnamed protein product [Didymodactylos carnosus]CAF0878253.1 unnamed protein product [Didymodactylos carnosus]CAF3635452.1 unnamed protein product [Didymodactylos carnosus]CAF3662341.1 unnamed protein product [Didymodactylos carnosus]
MPYNDKTHIPGAKVEYFVETRLKETNEEQEFGLYVTCDGRRRISSASFVDQIPTIIVVQNSYSELTIKNVLVHLRVGNQKDELIGTTNHKQNYSIGMVYCATHGKTTIVDDLF